MIKIKNIILCLILGLSSNIILAQETNKNINNNIIFNNNDWENLYNKLDKNDIIPNTLQEWKNSFEKYYNNHYCKQNICQTFTKLIINKPDNNELILNLEGKTFKDNTKILLPYILNNKEKVYPTIINGENIKINYDKDNLLLIEIIKKKDFNIMLKYKIKEKENINFINSNLTSYAIIDNKTNYNVIKNKNNFSLTTENKENIINEDNKIFENTIKVYRKLSEEIPFQLITRVELSTINENQKINLGSLIPRDFVITEIKTNNVSLNYENNAYIAIGSIGKSVIEINAEYNNLIEKINLPTLEENIVPAEIMTIEKNNLYGGLSLKTQKTTDTTNSIISIDPTLTHSLKINNKDIYLTIPNKWKNLDSYLITNNIIEIEKNTINKAIFKENYEQAIITRNTAIGFDNLIYDNLIFNYKSDKINNEIFFSQNINSAKNNEEPLVLLEKESKPYILLKDKESLLNVNIIEKNNDFVKKLIVNPTNIKNIDLSQWSVSLAPKNNIIFFTGAKEITNSWQSTWSLYSFFGLVILTFSFYKIFGKTVATIVGISIFLNIQNTIFSFVFWPLLLIFVALLNALQKENKYDNTFILKITKFSVISIGILFTLFTFFYTTFSIKTMLNPSYLYQYNNQNINNSSIVFNKQQRAISANAPTIAPAPMMESAMVLNSLKLDTIPNIPEQKNIELNNTKKQISIEAPKYIGKKYFIKSFDKEVILYISPKWLTNIFNILNIFLYWLIVFMIIFLLKNNIKYLNKIISIRNIKI